jgi:hypothetical protein
MLVNAAEKAAAKVAGKAVVKQLADSSLPLLGNIATGVWPAADAAMAIENVIEIKAAATAALERLDILRGKIEGLQELAGKFKDFKNLPPGQQLKKALEIATDGQDLLAMLNACTRARKCNLVPFRSKGRVLQGAGGPPPDLWCDDGGCAKYRHREAPTGCGRHKSALRQP